MELKVKAVDTPETKSVQEVEEQLIAEAEARHEGKAVEATEEEAPVAEESNNEGEIPVVRLGATEPEATETEEVVSEEVTEEVAKEEAVTDTNDTEPSIAEGDVLSFLKSKYGKDAATLDELFNSSESSDSKEELPEDVAAYLQYKEKTGRGMQDYLKLNRSFEDADPDTLLKEYLSDTETDLDAEDINDLLEEYNIDEDVMSDKEVRKIKRAKKRAVAKAKEYFTEQSKMYAEPTVTVAYYTTSQDSEALSAYRQSLKDAQTQAEANAAKSAAFDKATDNVFNGDFKGFDFSVDGKSFTYNAGTASELRSAQSTPMNFIGKFMDESGMISDAAGYHKALAVAMNPEKFAQFFFEQGQANATDNVLRNTKNINMGTRTAPEVASKGGTTIKSIPTSHGKGLKIKSRKR